MSDTRMTPVPNHCPSPRELDDLELLRNGAMAPQRTFDDLVAIDLPSTGVDVELVDPEGLPLALLEATGAAGSASGGSAAQSGPQAPNTNTPPAWAKRMQRSQTVARGATTAGQALRSGDQGGSGHSPDLSEGD